MLKVPLRMEHYTSSSSAGSHPYFVCTPTSYQVGTAVPLLVMLHGCTQTAGDFAAGTHMNQLAEQYGFIVVYPQQTPTYSSSLCWNWFTPSNQRRDHGEPASIAGIVQTIVQHTSQWTIDTNRIYVAGISAGAAMAVILGATYPDIFAAIGVHSGVEYQAATSLTRSIQVMQQGGPDPVLQGQRALDAMEGFSRRVPTIVFHGTYDTIISPINGDQTVQQWMQTDHLASNGTYQADFHRPNSTTDGQVPGGHAYTVSSWIDTKGDEVQAYWKVQGMGHAWSGGSPDGTYTDPLGPNASLAMYQFFMGHPLRRTDGSFWRRLRRALVNFFKPK
jgi:poly(hydroxyalkanoate) depolymerase family esterase